MRRWLLPVGTFVVVLAVFAAYWFQPWKLFTNKTVEETAPQIASSTAPRSATPTGQPTPSAAATLVAQGRFVTHEHDTTGTAQLVRLPTGAYQLILRDLRTSDGPDLRVWLTDQTVGDDWYAFDDGRHVELGRLKGNRGTQVYDVPATADVTALRSVSVWCKRFSVSFGAAQLA
ncbi:DM13 domain-containing protein [Luedemannella helvata]|uniref:DM13 domain-containing protein n=1 Tax=Luedemannella helvata TaxID=349315 RepID=A0ABP4XFV6_9ACTN